MTTATRATGPSRPRELVYERPWLYPRQAAAIFCPERYAVIEASTKSGKMVGSLAWLFEQATQGHAGEHFWWLAPIYGQTKIAFRRLKAGLPPSLAVANEGELTVALPNGTTLWFKSGEKADALYGENVHAAVVDEASRFREESWHALRSTLTATRGPVRLIGNVKGRRNWFYHLARRAESGEPDMRYTKITWRDAVESGILAADEIEDARRMLPEAVFRELFEAEPSDDAGNPFGLAAIQRCLGPLSEAPPICWGWDLAKSVDWTVGVALDAAGAVARIERWQAPWEETIGNIAAATAGLPALVDSTGVGDPILEALQRRGTGHFEGFKFSGPSKQQLMEGLAVAIQQQAIRFPAGVLVQELEAFEYEYRRTGVSYAAPEGLHDDAVCALALAVQHRRVGVMAPFRVW